MTESTHTGTSTEAAAARRPVRLAVLVAGGLVVAYHLFVRPWHLDWGATDDEAFGRAQSSLLSRFGW